MARVSSLLNNFDDVKKFLTDAAREMAIPPLSVYFVEPDFNYFRSAPWFASLGSICGTDSQSVLKKALISMGFSLTSKDDTLRFPLYMGPPQGPIPERIYESGSTEYARFIDKKENKERLEDRLQKNGFRVKDVPGDGNCQFYSISDQMYGDISHAEEIRKDAADWLRRNSDKDVNGIPLSCFIFDETWDEFCDKVSTNGVWGDHLTLIAVANVYNLRIVVISSVKGDNYMTEVYPDPPLQGREPPRSITISHFAEFHYNSVVPL